jgi:tetratricopeptide (TPR) repeat protein
MVRLVRTAGAVLGAGVLAAALLGALPATAGPPLSFAQPDPEIGRLLSEVSGRLQADDCDGARESLERLLGHPRLSKAGPNVRAVAYTSAGMCAAEAGRIDEAYDWLLKAQKTGAEGPLPAALVLFGISAEASPAYGVAAAERLLREPDGLKDVPPWRLLEFNRTLRRAEHAALHLRLLDALARAAYVSPDPLTSVDDLWRDHAIELDRAGRAAEVPAALARITDADVLMMVRVDRRFARFVGADPARYEPRRALEARLTGLAALKGQSGLDAEVKGLATVHEVMILHRLGRLEEARALAERTLTPLPSREVDGWLKREIGMILWDQGRFDEALAWLDTHGRGRDAAWLITRGSYLEAAARPKEVLALVDPVEAPGLDADSEARADYAWILVQKACALQQLGRRSELKRTVAWLEAERFTAPDTESAYGWAALCAGDRAAVRDIYLRRLADPFEAADALVALGDFRDPPGVSARSRQLSKQQKSFRNDPAVKAAAAKAGKIETFDLMQSPTDVF